MNKDQFIASSISNIRKLNKNVNEVVNSAKKQSTKLEIKDIVSNN